MKSKIITGIIIVLVLGLVGFKYYSWKHPDSPLADKEIIAEKGESTHIPMTETTASKSSNHIDVKTETPINGTLKGVIEVGASGFNLFVVNIDKDKNWELVTKVFGESLAYEGFASVNDIMPTFRKYLGQMFEKGVSGRNAHFVMSSGALKNPKSQLLADAIEKLGYVVNRVDADKEGKFALKALLPKNYKDNSFVVDIGSGNTKITWYSDGKVTSLEASGAKYYQDNKTDPSVYDEIKGVVSKVPQANRQYCFIIGGVPFKLAKESRGGSERFTTLKSPDDYSAGDDVKIKSGLNIYRSIYENSGCQNYIFDWDANFTIGFLLTLN